MWILIIATILTLTLIYAFRQTRYYKMARLLPQAKGVPIIGHALNVWVEKNELLDKIMEILNSPTNNEILTKEGILGVWLGPMVVVVLGSLSDIEQILTSRDLTEKSFHYKFSEPWLGKGLVTSSGAHWYSHRKLITPAFHFSILEKFIPIFNSNIEIYLKKLETKAGKGSFNIENYTAHLALDIIAETAMSAKVNAQNEESEYAQKVKELTETILLRGFRILYYPNFIFNQTNLGRRERRNREYVNNFINKLVNQKKKERDKINQIQEEVDDIGSKKRVALLDLLIDTQRNNSFFTDQDILDEVNTFMFAGHDTITSGTNFTLYLLSRHPVIQDELVKEIHDVVGNGSFTFSNLQELKYLERVIKESLRIYSVAPFIIRSVKHETKLKSGYILPAGCTLFFFLYKLHRNPELFPEPEKFDPDRFLPENCAKRHPFAYLPFSAGPRNCIGQKFAMFEMKAIIAATVRKYRLLPSGPDVKPVAHIILRSANGIHLTLEERRNHSLNK